jgi:hypothetical protein
MAKKAGAWIESRRCLVCNDRREENRKVGFMKDPNNEGKWIPCMSCNNKGYNTKTGTIAN